MLERNNAAECHFEIVHKRNKKVPEGTFCTDFVIKNVTATCHYICIAFHLQETKSVAVAGNYAYSYVRTYHKIIKYNFICFIDAVILATPSNITTFEGMPIELKCTVKYTVQSKYKMVWMKEDAFITGYGYSFKSTEFDSKTNTQNHYLTIHKASSGAFTCKLISTNMIAIDTKTQHVVTKSEDTFDQYLYY